jgi:hypothetical protein
MKEVVDEAEELSKQMNFLIAFRIKVDKVGFGNVDTNIGNSSSSFIHADHGNHGKPFLCSVFLLIFIINVCLVTEIS